MAWVVAMVVATTAPLPVHAVVEPGQAEVYQDLAGDAVLRPTDPGRRLAIDPQSHPPIDLVRISVGRWKPDEPSTDLFEGALDSDGGFLLTEIVFDGLVNPPGANGPSVYAPFIYGDAPVYGFVELNMDDQNETGGEIDAPRYRFLGNVARFGGVPSDGRFEHRVAVDGSAFDGWFSSPPYVDRSGEEFHLALLGEEFLGASVAVIVGDTDAVFESGETWGFFGTFLHRAHGFEPFSLANGGSVPGEYAPLTPLRFSHDANADETTITVVFPLDNDAAAELFDQPPQPDNGDASDHASILEGLMDLRLSAEFVRMFPTGLPEEALIRDWAAVEPLDCLEPEDWKVTALFGTAYAQPSGFDVDFIWTDTYPNPVFGDFDGDGRRTDDDREAIEAFIAARDADDGVDDGRVVIGDFARDFSVLDLNYDGVVDATDVVLVETTGDSDRDSDVDLQDAALFQRCFGLAILTFSECAAIDFDGTGTTNSVDWSEFVEELSGPEDR